ncbi:MAG: SDR family NAD(P)-dependent oxidoreductase, partial [Myxococcota bacterium]
MSSNSTHWTTESVPNQQGRLVVITGANSGIGFEAALELARKGAHVVLACRNLTKGRDAVQRIHDQLPKAQLELRELDLADLASVRSFAQSMIADHDALHMLINNAGVMALPYR